MIPKHAMNPGPVFSAGKRGGIVDCLAGGPSMDTTIRGWFKPIVVGVQTSVPQPGGTFKEIFRDTNTSGVLQPDEERIDRQPGGNRSWQHWVLHCLPEMVLKTNDRIRIGKNLFRVDLKRDFNAYGYIRYSLTQDFQNAPTS